MKKRVITINVTRKGQVVPVFAKTDCSPQDIISALSLFGDDGVKFEIAVDDVELDSTGQSQN